MTKFTIDSIKEKSIPLGTISIGELFCYNNKYYMKTDEIKNNDCRVVNLNSGVIVYIRKDIKVQLLTAYNLTINETSLKYEKTNLKEMLQDFANNFGNTKYDYFASYFSDEIRHIDLSSDEYFHKITNFDLFTTITKSKFWNHDGVHFNEFVANNLYRRKKEK